VELEVKVCAMVSVPLTGHTLRSVKQTAGLCSVHAGYWRTRPTAAPPRATTATRSAPTSASGWGVRWARRAAAWSSGCREVASASWGLCVVLDGGGGGSLCSDCNWSGERGVLGAPFGHSLAPRLSEFVQGDS